MTEITTTRRPSLALRAILAVLLTAGFYGLSLSIAGVMLFLVYAEVVYAHRINIRVTLVLVFVAGTILWSILPRIERFHPPGPRLQREQHPKLFALIEAVARQTGQAMPAEVYLLADVNAFVAQYGGFLGLGSRRIMGIGLPLLQILDQGQIKAVLAHEFGHLYGGDTRLGPWIYQTRAAMIRTVGNLGNSILQWPFRKYTELFLRITQAISRRQELVADELSVQVAGTQAAIDCLNIINRVAPAFNAYWEQEIVPVLDYGCLPPLTNGFSHFMQVEEIARAMDRSQEEAFKVQKAETYASHPAPSERMAAIRALPYGPQPQDPRPALDLLDNNLAETEKRLLSVLYGAESINKLTPISWQEAGRSVYVQIWQDSLQPYAPALNGFTPESLPNNLAVTPAFKKLLKENVQGPPNQGPVPEEVYRQIAAMLLGRALGLCLVRAGWEIEALPGEPVRLSHQEHSLHNDLIPRQLTKGELSAEDWVRRCEEMGIRGLRLAL